MADYTSSTAIPGADPYDADGPTVRAEGLGDIAVSLKQPQLASLQLLRVHFRRLSGTGTDTASLTLDVDSHKGAGFDTRLKTITGAGVSADVNMRIPRDELDAWTIGSRDALQVNWTNPDALGEIAWGLEAWLVRPR